jgi:hypothetical protein
MHESLGGGRHWRGPPPQDGTATDDGEINIVGIDSPPRVSLEATRGVADRSWLRQREIAALGKTLPPFSQLSAYERRRWAPFKWALPKEDQAIFDRLFDCAKLHIQAGVMVSRPWPFETIVMAILLEQQKLRERLASLLGELQGRDQT